jgi:predicted LPLAT superfamily acyltransferase
MADGLSSKTILEDRVTQWTDLFDCIPFKVTFEDDSIVANAVYDGGGTVAVIGASLGDFVLVAPELDIADMHFHANVTAADVVTIILSNNTGGTLTTFASGAVINGLVLSPKGRFNEIN